MTTTLYEIADARDILESWLAESEGELTPELEALLGELNGKADEKIERVALYIREQLALAEAMKGEEQRIAARRKAREKAADSLKMYLQREMERLGKERVNGLLATVAIAKNPLSVRGEIAPDVLAEWMDTQPDFVTYKPATYALNKTAIIVAFKDKLPIPEGLSVEQSTSLRIR